MSNPFTLSFGKKPFEYISRIRQTDEILEDFGAEHPVSQVYMLTGLASIDGAAPVTDIEVAIERMLKIIKMMKKRVLITIDEVENSQTIREFVSSFQIFMREEYPVFLLMAGLYENINALQNSNNVTFLYRAPKIEMGPFDTEAIVKSYMDIFDIDIDHAKYMASLTMGYPLQ